MGDRGAIPFCICPREMGESLKKGSLRSKKLGLEQPYFMRLTAKLELKASSRRIKQNFLEEG